MQTNQSEALGLLRAAKATMLEHEDIKKIIEARDEVIARYSPVFQKPEILKIDEDVLRSFLYFENNKHWSGLNRQVNRVCADMDSTRAALFDLVDELRPIETRIGPVTLIKGMGKGIITAILHVTYPNKYGVWNNTSHGALVELGLMPEMPRGASFGDRYAAVNQVLNDLSQALEIDLWTLDAIWWNLRKDGGGDHSISESAADEDASLSAKTTRFALERHLHDYMYDNWDNLDISEEWSIYSKDGEPDAGYEFTTPIGRIDLLAKHNTQPKWMVIELKRHKSSDAVVGQVLRYIGWVRAHLIEEGETVEGLIVATQGDPQLHYAISAVPTLSFKSYEVEFQLKNGPTFEEYSKP